MLREVVMCRLPVFYTQMSLKHLDMSEISSTPALLHQEINTLVSLKII